MTIKKLQGILAVISLIISIVSCAGSGNELPDTLAPPDKNLVGIRIITRDGGHLAWSKYNNKIAFDRLGRDKYFDLWIMNPDGSGQKSLTINYPHYINRPFVVAADFDWSPEGRQIAALVLTNRPETRKRGSGIDVLIDLP